MTEINKEIKENSKELRDVREIVFAELDAHFLKVGASSLGTGDIVEMLRFGHLGEQGFSKENVQLCVGIYLKRKTFDLPEITQGRHPLQRTTFDRGSSNLHSISATSTCRSKQRRTCCVGDDAFHLAGQTQDGGASCALAFVSCVHQPAAGDGEKRIRSELMQAIWAWNSIFIGSAKDFG